VRDKLHRGKTKMDAQRWLSSGTAKAAVLLSNPAWKLELRWSDLDTRRHRRWKNFTQT
jgi:hypothetical protein